MYIQKASLPCGLSDVTLGFLTDWNSCHIAYIHKVFYQCELGHHVLLVLLFL